MQILKHTFGELKRKLNVQFVGEEISDPQATRKEWFLLMSRYFFEESSGLLVYDRDSNLGYLNSLHQSSDDFFLLGAFIGLAIFNGCLLNQSLSLALYRKVLSTPVTLHDLAQLRPQIANSLKALLNYHGHDFEETFGLQFTAFDSSGQEIALIDNGTKISVTKENRMEYVSRFVDYHLSAAVDMQFQAFKHGFLSVCGGNALSLFRAEELDLMLQGSADPIDIEQLRRITVYDGFSADETTIVNFWAYVKTLSATTQRKLLDFATASERLPSTGFQAMNFRIACIGEDCDRLPSSNTCFNTLYLYRYQSKRKLAHKMDAALKLSARFGFD